jgi:multisubunit Na+/H+ antiporter MnhE subunit
LFFQFSFYWYIFVTLNKSFLRVIKLCFYLLNPFKKFTSIIDYIFLDKDSDSRAVLTANILSLQPGIIGTLLKKRYLIIHSMDESFFSLNDLYKTSSQVEEIKND